MTSAKRMKQENEKRILKAVYEEPGIYRKRIAKQTGLSSQAVTNQVNSLVKRNLLKETGNRPEGKGRSPVSLELNRDQLYLLTVRIELRRMEVALHTLDCRVIAQEKQELSQREDVLQCLKDQIRRVMESAGKPYLLQALVISVTGVVDEQRGVVVSAEKLHFCNTNLKEKLSYLGIPILVRNDVNLIAAYEKTVRKDSRNFMVVKIDVGIGASFVLGGSDYRGSNHVAGELGHVTVETEEVRPCSCGKTNCLTKFISREALEEEYGDTYEQLVLDVKAEKPKALDQVKRIGRYLAPLLINSITLLDLDHIILCGCSVDHFTPLLFTELEKCLKGQLSWWLFFQGLKLHSNVSIVQISTGFWLDYFFSSDGTEFLTENMVKEKI